MRLVFGALGDPALKQFLLLRSEMSARIRRGHLVVGIGREDASDQLGIIRLARLDGFLFQRDFAHVQAELGFAIVFVRAVAEEAVVRENGPDIAIELEFSRHRRGGVDRFSGDH